MLWTILFSSIFLTNHLDFLCEPQDSWPEELDRVLDQETENLHFDPQNAFKSSIDQIRAHKSRLQANISKPREILDGATWLDKAERLQMSSWEDSYLMLERAERKVLALRKLRLPVPVLTSIQDIEAFDAGRLKSPVKPEDILVIEGFGKAISDGERHRLVGLVEASLQVAEAMPSDATAKQEEIDFILEVLTNPRALYEYRESQIEKSKDIDRSFQRLHGLLQKMYELRALKQQAARSQDDSAREAILRGLSDDANQYFNSDQFPVEDEFLNAVGAKPMGQLPESTDLSALFKAPTHQCLKDGTPTYACTAFAVVSDMETHEGVPSLSKGYPFGLAVMNHTFMDRMIKMLDVDIERAFREVRADPQFQRSSERVIENEVNKRLSADPVASERWRFTQTSFEEMAKIPLPGNALERFRKLVGEEDFKKAERGQLSGTIPPVMMHMFKERPIPEEKDFPWPKIMPGHDEISDGYRIVNFATTQPNIDSRPVDGVKDFDFYRLLLANGIPLSFSYNTDARYTVEGWFYPVDMTENDSFAGHIINIVGYGVEPDPMTGKPTAYFLVRDSLQKEPIHWKTPVHQMLPRAFAVHRVTAVERTKTE